MSSIYFADRVSREMIQYENAMLFSTKQRPGVSPMNQHYGHLCEITTLLSTIKCFIIQPGHYNVCRTVLSPRTCGDFPDLPLVHLLFVLSASISTVRRSYTPARAYCLLPGWANGYSIAWSYKISVRGKRASILQRAWMG